MIFPFEVLRLRSEAGGELVRFVRSLGLVKGETVAIDGSKFRAVSSAKSVGEREAMKCYRSSWMRSMNRMRW